MANKDHYVAQTYLKSFSITGKIGFVNVIMKNNLQRLNEIPVKSICYEKDWSTNEYFPENPRVVEDYLKNFEPKWAACIEKISDGKFDEEIKSLMAGYIAYLRVYTPTAVRLGQCLLAESVKQIYDIIERRELLNPNSKHRDAIKKIRESGGVRIIDLEKGLFAKALGTYNLFNIQEKFFISPWRIFKNETTTPFITSDNPVSLQYWNNDTYFYCPITPQIVVEIRPIHDKLNDKPDYLKLIKPEDVEMINQLVVKCAEEKVIFNEKALDVEGLVKEYQNWREELPTNKIPTEKGSIIIFQERPIERATCDTAASV